MAVAPACLQKQYLTIQLFEASCLSAAVESPIRFDAILVAPGKIPRHLPGAFDATQRSG